MRWRSYGKKHPQSLTDQCGEKTNQNNQVPSLAVDRLGRCDFDAKAGQSDVTVLGGGQKSDRRDAEISEDLGAEADFTPLAIALSLRSRASLLRRRSHRHARGAIAQDHDDTMPLLFEPTQHRAHRRGAS